MELDNKWTYFSELKRSCLSPRVFPRGDGHMAKRLAPIETLVTKPFDLLLAGGGLRYAFWTLGKLDQAKRPMCCGTSRGVRNYRFQQVFSFGT